MTALDCVAPLFVPASRPDRFAKAAESDADAVILDLEDAVPAEAKRRARSALVRDFTAKPVFVRVNAANSPWHADDIAAVAAGKFAALILPKAEQVKEIAPLAKIAPVIALIETARGVANARELAASGLVARIAFGSFDYAVDIGADPLPEALVFARAELVLASRLGGLPGPLDGVTAEIRPPCDGVLDDVRYARAMGFSGKLAIHPGQIPNILLGFTPSPTEVEWASKVLESGDGAVAVEGMMVDEPVRRRAAATLRRAAGNFDGSARPTQPSAD